jgi:hypothetical protein
MNFHERIEELTRVTDQNHFYATMAIFGLIPLFILYILALSVVHTICALDLPFILINGSKPLHKFFGRLGFFRGI